MQLKSLATLNAAGRIAPGALVVVRVVTGAVFVGHALHYSPAQFGGLAEEVFGLPAIVGWLAVLQLYVGGALLIVGLLSRLNTLPAILHMVLAVLLWDLGEGFTPAEGGGMQIPLLLIAGCVVILAFGPGPMSVDRLLGWDTTVAPGPRRAVDAPSPSAA